MLAEGLKSQIDKTIEYRNQIRTRNGNYNSMNTRKASREGLVTQKVISDFAHALRPAANAPDIRVGVGFISSLTKDGKNNLTIGVEGGTDGAKLSMELAAKNSAEIMITKNRNVSPNITLFDKTIAVINQLMMGK